MRAAIIGGAFVVLAAAIAGGTAMYNSRALQAHEDRQVERQIERENLREAVRAKGAARLLFSELYGMSRQMAILSGDRVFRRLGPSQRVEMRTSDMLLIAARLEPEQWSSVQDALKNADDLDTFVNTQIERGRVVLTKGEACLVRHDIRSILYAADALSDLAVAPGKPTQPKPIRCKPGPGPLPPELRQRLDAAGVKIDAPPLPPGAASPP